MKIFQQSVEMRKLIAEFLGAFAIVFAPVGAAGAAQVSGGSSNLLEAALVSGFPVFAMIAALGHVSGAHFNPAVTLALAAAKKFEWKLVVPYCICQALGGIAAAGLVWALFGSVSPHIPVDPGAIGRNLGIEIAITFILMFTILGSTSDRARTALAPIAIGLVVVVGVLIGGPITGGSMNPARSLGPNLFAGGAAMTNFWIYLVGPIAGALLAVFADRLIREPGKETIAT